MFSKMLMVSGGTIVCGDVTLVHGIFRIPMWEYMVNIDIAVDTFRRLDTPYCFLGHSHFPFHCKEIDTGIVCVPFMENEVVSRVNQRAIINPGSVEQPRDGSPRASYVLYDDRTSTLRYCRVTCDREFTQVKMRRIGFPEYLIQSLNYGK